MFCSLLKQSVVDAYRSYRLSSFIRAHLHCKKANVKANIFLLDVNQVFECRENPSESEDFTFAFAQRICSLKRGHAIRVF